MISLTNLLLFTANLALWGIAAVTVGPNAYMLFRLWLINAAHPPEPEHGHGRESAKDKFYRLDMTEDVFAKHLPYFQREGLVKGSKKEGNGGHAGTYL